MKFVILVCVSISLSSMQALAETIGSEVKIRIDWKEAGDIRLDGRGKLMIPEISCDPAVYRFQIGGEKARSVYVGETKNLCKRMQTYRTPGPSQATNVRLNKIIRDRLVAGGRVTISTIDADHGKGSNSWNFSNKFHRVMLEHAAIVIEQRKNVILLNEVAGN